MVIDNSATRLRWSWRGLALFYLALMVHFAIYHFVQGQCTSTSCVLLALSQIGIGILVIVFALSISLPLTHRLLQHFANIPPGLFLVASATVLFGFGLNLRLEWIYAHMSLALSGIAALAYFSIYGNRLPNVQRRTVVIGMILLVLVVILIRVRALAVDPSIHILDEPWTLSWAVSYLRTGKPSDWIMGSVSGSPYYSLPRYYALVAAWLQLVGVGLWEGRLFSVIVAALMSIFTVLAARNLFDRQTALFTLLALLASSILVVGLRLRHDIGVGLTISASLWVYSVARKRNSWALHGVAGFCAGLGLSAHYHALGLSVALAAGLYLPEYFERIHRKQFFPQPEAIAYCCGAMISGLLILALQVLPDIQQFQEYLAPRSPHSLQEFVESVIYHVAQLPQHSQLEFILVVVALSAALLRRTKLDISLSLVLILSYIALGAMASKNYGPFDYYSVPLIPLLGLLIGRFWGSLNIGRLLPTASSSIAVVSCLCFLIPQLGYSLHSPLAYIRADGSLRPNPTPAAQWVLDHVRPDQTIMAENSVFHLAL